MGADGEGSYQLARANPAIGGDTDHWYKTEAQAQAIVNAKKDRLQRIADSRRYDSLI